MDEIKDILQDIKIYYKKYPNNIPKHIKDKEQEILNIKINEEDKCKVLNLIYKYNIERLNNDLFNNLINSFKLQNLINSNKEYNYYDTSIHKYLNYKIKYYEGHTSKDKVENYINTEKNLKVKKELKHIFN